MKNIPGEKYPVMKQELKDWKVSSKEELTKADSYSYLDNKRALADFLWDNEGTKPEIIEAFIEEDDHIEKLKLLTEMSLHDAVDMVELYSKDDGVSRYLSGRLDFYDNLVEGTATKIAPHDGFYFDKNEDRDKHVSKGEEVLIDNRYITPHDIAKGIFRDVCYAQMIGSPEMGIYKMAKKRLKKQEVSEDHLPQVKGSRSHIEQGEKESEGNIGVAYPFLRELYNRALDSIKRKQEAKGNVFSEEKFEHKAVLMATDWLAESMKYNSSDRSPDSSYVSTPEEAIAWARLGKQVKAQFKGMRQKIEGVDLHGISRFIGKSGDTEYAYEYRELKRQIEEGDSSEETKEKLIVAEKKYTRHASLAQRAIDLHFRLRNFELGSYSSPSIDWINDAPLGLIKWTHTALSRGVSEKTAFGYARAYYMFPDAVIDREIIDIASKISSDDAVNVNRIDSINIELGIRVSTKELFKLGKYSSDIYRKLIKIGYTIESLISNPWLGDKNIVDLPEGEEFPFDSKETKQRAWCVEHAFNTPDGWNRKRLGAIILRRLQIGIDENIHDATYWLNEFNVPDSKSDIVYKDHVGEIELLQSLTDVPNDVRRRIPSKRNKYEILFSEDATQLIYEATIPLAKKGTVTYEQIADAVNAILDEFETNPRRARSIKTPLPKLKERVEVCLKELKHNINENTPFKPVPNIVGGLKVTGNNRADYINTSQKWVEAHSTTPRTLLTLAWANRDLALADGCDDNPRAIKQWADAGALRGAYDKMEKHNKLPDNISREDLTDYKDWLKELVRCYNGTTAIRTLSEIKTNYNPEFQISPATINLGNGITGEIFAKNDPRGCTIGNDTGCCMTLNGESKSCIKAGYEKPPYGFFALYRKNELLAQSFLYNNSEENPDTIVCDNIEANDGRDKKKILELYKEFFGRYLEERLRRDSDPRFSKVHIGEGYSSVGLDNLKEVKSVLIPDSGIYTDARSQRLLFEIGKERAEILKDYKSSVFEPEMWESIKDSIMEVENSAFDEKGYSEEQLKAEFSDPENIVVVIKDGEKIIGYSTALPKDDETLYVSSTALLSNYQGKGLVSDIMYTLDNEATERGYEYYERHAAVSSGYAEKLKRNYEMVEEGDNIKTPQGIQQYLKMKIPNHIPSSRLDKQKEIKQPEERVAFTDLSADKSAVVAELEKGIYPSGLIQTESDWREEFENDSIEYKGGNASFLVMEHGSGEPVPIGYAVAYMAESEMYNDNSVVLYVRDMALMEDKQRKGYGRQALQRLVKFASGRGIPIEFYARESTSYKAIKNSTADLQKMGYEVVEEELDRNHADSGENFYLLRLEGIK